MVMPQHLPERVTLHDGRVVVLVGENEVVANQLRLYVNDSADDYWLRILVNPAGRELWHSDPWPLHLSTLPNYIYAYVPFGTSFPTIDIDKEELW